MKTFVSLSILYHMLLMKEVIWNNSPIKGGLERRNTALDGIQKKKSKETVCHLNSCLFTLLSYHVCYLNLHELSSYTDHTNYIKTHLYGNFLSLISLGSCA